MARIISVINQKGGTGKTVSVVNISSFLAMKGYKVIVVDFDPQANASVHFGVQAQKLEYSIYDVITHSRTIASVMLDTGIKNLNLIPSHINLSAAEFSLVTEMGRENVLKKSLGILSDYDYILIDCPPSLGILTVNALVAAEYVLIPVEAEYFALIGTELLTDTIELVNTKLNHKSAILGYFMTRYNVNRNMDKYVSGKIIDNFSKGVFETRIRRDVKLAEASLKGKSIFQYAPSSNGALDYENLSEEIIDRVNNKLYNYVIP